MGARTDKEVMRPVGISFDTATRELVDRIASEEERSRSSVVRRAIRTYAATQDVNR